MQATFFDSWATYLGCEMACLIFIPAFIFVGIILSVAFLVLGIRTKKENLSLSPDTAQKRFKPWHFIVLGLALYSIGIFVSIILTAIFRQTEDLLIYFLRLLFPVLGLSSIILGIILSIIKLFK